MDTEEPFIDGLLLALMAESANGLLKRVKEYCLDHLGDMPKIVLSEDNDFRPPPDQIGLIFCPNEEVYIAYEGEMRLVGSPPPERE
jgi:hypothetical protein